MHDIYHYTPEINHVSKVYIVAAVLYLQIVLHAMSFPMLNMFRIVFHQHFPQYVCSAQYGCFL